mmetsp:Transcript_22516/g.51706  ORF Transcript_22516/g.51706 Transcript_22516/m.51706 type:complete len:80 (-) Transcript_22516:158-397(-)
MPDGFLSIFHAILCSVHDSCVQNRSAVLSLPPLLHLKSMFDVSQMRRDVAERGLVGLSACTMPTMRPRPRTAADDEVRA